MTLILGLARPEGVYVSADHRLTYPGGRVADDATAKHVTVHYPPMLAGPRALITFTGVAHAADKTPTGQWIRETIRGQQDDFDTSMQHLRDRLDRDFGPLRQALILNVLVVHGDLRYSGGLSNLHLDPQGVMSPPDTTFGYVMEPEPGTCYFGSGSGAAGAKAAQILEPLARQSEIRPRRPRDYLNLLGVLNRRIAAINKTVSPHCQAAFLPCSSSGYEPQSWIYTEGTETVPLTMPIVISGIDVSDMLKSLFESSQALVNDPTKSLEEENLPTGDTDRRP